MSEQFSKQLSDALRVLVGIVRLKNGPEDLPYSPSLLVASVAGAAILDALLFAMVPTPDDFSPLPLLILNIVTTLIWYGALLRFAGKPERFVQTMTAVYGFQVILAPLMLFTGWFVLTYQKDPNWAFPSQLVRSAVEIWALVILARILRSATQWPLFTCVVLAMANELLTLLLAASLFSSAAPAT